MIRPRLPNLHVLAVVLLLAGCKASPIPRQEPDAALAAEPPAPSIAPAAAARAPPGGVDGGAAREASRFSIRCELDPDTPYSPGAPAGLAIPSIPSPSSSCILRGRVRSVRAVELAREAEPGSGPHEWRSASLRALDVQIQPDDAVPCRTPLDRDVKSPLGPDRSRRVLVLGGARIAGALREGASVCGWVRHGLSPGDFPPDDTWEGELADGSGALLGAGSGYLDREAQARLGSSWRFSREGPVERRPLSEGGAFLLHQSVRIERGGASALSTHGAEVVLSAPDGTFAVTATSALTEGDVPVYVGRHDGFAFSAVRLAANDGVQPR